MYKTLVVYDLKGKILTYMSGSVEEPDGVPFMWIEIPEGKILKSIDTTKEVHEPVFREIMEIDTDNCTIEQLKNYLISKSKENLEAYLAAHPITSKCHAGEEKKYSITKDKQALLTQMILITQVATNAGQEYHPSWNAQGEPCTYDWTLQELQQLAFEIEAIVRPLISHQQTMEFQINTAVSKEEALLITIEF